MKKKRLEDLWGHVHALGMLDEEGSYTAAAKRVGLSKAAMSNRVSELEEALGTELVKRTTRSVRLTEAGQRLVDDTRSHFSEIEVGVARVRGAGRAPSGLVRVTAPVALGRQHVVPHMAEFLQRYPEVRVELELSDRLTSLTREGFDLAIRHTDAVPETHVASTLCATRSVLVASRVYLRKSEEPTVPSDLLTHNCLHYPRGVGAVQWTFEFTGGTRVSSERTRVPIRGSFAANNSEALRELALHGCGIALLPDFSVAADLHARRLVQVMKPWLVVGTFGNQIYALRPHTAHVSTAVRALVQHLRGKLKPGFPI